ncbi:MAG TPA: autotransporter-associated beta strand repeat-containing protein, partial [Tepidisphaeraceae bacterium]|nr:autotransporter-associated beta strand repeat-containing protein [Tepidisphaeraceae bacterium]
MGFSKSLTRNRCRFAIAVAAGTALLAVGPRVSRGDQTWSGGSVGGNGNWSNPSNWVGGAAPGSTTLLTNTDIAIFNAPIANTWGLVGTPIVIDSTTQNIGGITFDTASDNYFIGTTAGNSLLLTNGGTIQILSTLTSTNAIETINAPLVLEGTGGSYNFVNNSANGAVAGAGTLNIGGAVKAAAGLTILNLGGSNTNANTISGIISDGAAGATLGITKTGAGTWVISGTSTYSGPTTLNASGGTLKIGGAGSLGAGNYAGNIAVGTGSTFQYSSSAAQTLSGAISGGGTFLKDTSSSVLTLTGTETYTGPTTLGTSSGTLQIAGSGSLNSGAYAGNIAIGSGSSLEYSSSATQTLSGVISGAGTVVKDGASSVLTLTGINSVSNLTVNAGTLKLDSTFRTAANFSSGNMVVGSGGTLELYNTNATIDNGTGLLTTGTVLSGSGTFNKTGAGYIDFWNNTSIKNFTGTINVQAGTLASNGSDWGSSIGAMALNISSGAFFDVRTGSVIVNQLAGAGTVGTSYQQSVTLSVGAQGGSSAFTGIIENTLPNHDKTTGIVGLTKIGNGTLTLSGLNTYAGATTVNRGTLLLDLSTNSAGVLNSLTPLTLGGGTISVQGQSGSNSNQTVASLALTAVTASSIVLNPLFSNSTTLTITSPTIPTGANASVDFNYSAGTTLGTIIGDNAVNWSPTLTAGIIGGGYTVTDSGGTGLATVVGGQVVRLVDNGSSGLPVATGSATSNYFVNAGYSTTSTSTNGSLVLALSGPVAANSVTIDTTNATAAPTLTLGTNVLTVSSGAIVFNGPNPYTVTATAGGGLMTATAGGSLILNNQISAGVTLSAPILDNTASGVVINGAGTLFLSAASTYTGPTILNGGIVNLAIAETAGSSGPLGTSAAANPGSIVLNGGILQYSANNQNDYSGRFSTAANQQYNVDTNGQPVTWATALTSAGGSLTKNGGGTLTVSGANTFTGSTTINQGAVTVSGTGSLADTAVLTIASGATLNLSGSNNNEIDGGTQAGTLNINGTLAVTTATAHTLYPTIINLNGGTMTSSVSVGTFGAFFVNLSRTITANGTGNTISAVNFGISSGQSLTLNTPLATDSLNATTSFFGSGASLIKSGLGTVTLAGAETYSTTTISAGTLLLSTTSTGTGTGNGFVSSIANNATLQFDTADTTVDTNTIGSSSGIGALTGTGTINKTGAGWTEFPGNVIKGFSGQINIQAGIFSNGYGTSTWGSSTTGMSVNISTGAVLDLRGNGIAIGTLNGSGTVGSSFSNFASTGNSTLTIGVNNATGGTFSGVIEGNASGGNNSTFLASAVSLVKTGTGTQTLSGINTYSGGTTINGGTLLYDLTKTSTDQSSPGPTKIGNVVINSGATLTLFTNAGMNYFTQAALPESSTITGSGTIIKTGASGIVDLFTGTNISGFTGLIDVQQGILADQSSSFTTGSQNLQVESGAFFDLRTSNVSVNTLNGSGTVASSYQAETLTVGALGGTSVFSGVIQNNIPTASGG